MNYLDTLEGKEEEIALENIIYYWTEETRHTNQWISRLLIFFCHHVMHETPKTNYLELKV